MAELYLGAEGMMVAYLVVVLTLYYDKNTLNRLRASRIEKYILLNDCIIGNNLFNVKPQGLVVNEQ